MRKYLNILLAATSCFAMGSCTNFDDQIPSIDSGDTETGLVGERLENGQTGVYLNMVPVGSTVVNITRSEGSTIENTVADGWAFVYGPALPSCFDTTNEDGYGHSSKLLQKEELLINANNVAFFSFNQYPWVDTAESADFTAYGAILDLDYYVDDAGYPIMTDGTMNYYFHAISGNTTYDGYYAPHVYYQAVSSDDYTTVVEAEYGGSGVEATGGYTEGVDKYVKFNSGGTASLPDDLSIIYCHATSDDAYGYYFVRKNNTTATDGTNNENNYYYEGQSGGNTYYFMLENGEPYYAEGSVEVGFEITERALTPSNLRTIFGEKYEYVDPEDSSETALTATDYETEPFVGINHMCFVRFMVNLTTGTTAEVEAFVSQRMINDKEQSYSDDQITYFEEYKHLSVGLDGYYRVEIDETYIQPGDLLTGGTPTPQGTYELGQLTNKHPMASPGLLMEHGLNAYTLYSLNDMNEIYLVRTAAKVTVETTDDDFSLIGVTLLNGAKRALMRSSVVDISGFSVSGSSDDLYSLSLPTNLCYEYRLNPDEENGETINRTGTIQYNEVLTSSTDDFDVYNFKSTADFPIYFFPNEGDYPLTDEAVSQYDYSLSRYLHEDTNISDPVNEVNPTYLIVRGYVAKYHDRNGNGAYDIITYDDDGTQMLNDEVGYYKIPIKYESIYVEGGTLDEKNTNEFTYDIIRNNFYQINITSVNSAGYKTFEEAEAGPASDVVYNIVVGDWSDDRNEYAVSNGTFYMETDVNDIFIKGYGDELSGVTFNVTVQDNESYSGLGAEALLETKADGATTYATPTLYITTSKGITLDSYVVNTYDEGNLNLSTNGTDTTISSQDVTTSDSTVTTYSGTANNFSSNKVEVKTTTTYANSNVYEIDVTSGDVNTLSFTVSKDIETNTLISEDGGGSIWIQAGDVYKEIKVYYEALAYVSRGGLSYYSDSGTYSSDYDEPFTVNGTQAFTSYNTILYDEDYFYYPSTDGDPTTDDANINYNYFSNVSSTASQDALAEEYGMFLTDDGYVVSNLYDDNGYYYDASGNLSYNINDNYAGHYLNRECRAIVHRKSGDGIAKIYLKQATDFAMLLGNGLDSDAKVASETTIAYTSRGYIYSLDFSDDGGANYSSNNNTNTISYYGVDEDGIYDTNKTTVSVGSNTPILFYAAGDVDRVDFVTVVSSNSYGVNTIINSESDAIQGRYVNTEFNGINFCSGGLSADNLESSSSQERVEFPDYENGDYGYRYTADTNTSVRSKIEADDQSKKVKSWYKAATGDMFDLWAYPILRNQGTQYNESDWEYHDNRAYIDDKTVITLSNIAGETKKYTFNLIQYALPFCDPSLVAGTSGGDNPIDILACNYPVDLGYNSNNGSSTNTNQDQTMSFVIGSFPFYNCYYNNSDDFKWASDAAYTSMFDDTDRGQACRVRSNTSYVSSYVAPQAYDSEEPEYVVFTVPVSGSTTTFTNANNAYDACEYFILTMYNAAEEYVQSAIQIIRDDYFVENNVSGFGGYKYFPMDFRNATNLQDNRYPEGRTAINSSHESTNSNTYYYYPDILDYLETAVTYTGPVYSSYAEGASSKGSAVTGTNNTTYSYDNMYHNTVIKAYNYEDQ